MPIQKYDDEFGTDIVNTRQMSLEPQRQEEFSMMDAKDGGKLELLPVMTGEYFLSLCCYPVLVEAWDHKKDGRRKRAWEATFTQAERNKIGRYYGRFYRWYLVTGTPKRVSCRLNTLQLLQRAVNFFANDCPAPPPPDLTPAIEAEKGTI